MLSAHIHLPAGSCPEMTSVPVGLVGTGEGDPADGCWINGDDSDEFSIGSSQSLSIAGR